MHPVPGAKEPPHMRSLDKSGEEDCSSEWSQPKVGQFSAKKLLSVIELSLSVILLYLGQSHKSELTLGLYVMKEFMWFMGNSKVAFWQVAPVLQT